MGEVLQVLLITKVVVSIDEVRFWAHQADGGFQKDLVFFGIYSNACSVPAFTDGIEQRERDRLFSLFLARAVVYFVVYLCGIIIALYTCTERIF